MRHIYQSAPNTAIYKFLTSTSVL